MPSITLTEEQTQIVIRIQGPVEIRDSYGNVLGVLDPKVTPQMIAELKRRAASPGPWYTGAQIQARLRALQDEWDRTGGFDEAYMLEFLKKLNAADPGHMRRRRSG